jgi:hypothetical protein
MKILALLLLTSCSIFKTHTVDRDLHKSTKKICLSSEGKGRLYVQKRKYIFSYESGLEEEQANWQLALNFPLRNTETFKLDWSKNGKVSFESSIEQKLLRENKTINPKSLEKFTTGLGHLLEEIINIRNIKKSGPKRFKWKTSRKSLKASSKNQRFNAVFTNLVSDSHFGLMSVSYQNSKTQFYKMDLVVRKCLE